MIVLILDEKDELHFGSGLDELFIDIEEGNERIEFGIWQLNDVKSHIKPE